MPPNNHAERRSRPRIKPRSLTYIELGKDNGGIVLNMSDGGLSFAAAGFISNEPSPPIRLRFTGSREWFEIPGQIVWTSESKKEAGVRFLNPTEADRERIKNWIASETSQEQRDAEALKIPERRQVPSIVPETVKPDAVLAAPSQIEDASWISSETAPEQLDTGLNKIPQLLQVPEVASKRVEPVSLAPESVTAATPPRIEDPTPDEREVPVSPMNSTRSSYSGTRSLFSSSDPPITEPLDSAEFQFSQYPTDHGMPGDGNVRIWLTSISLVSLVAIGFFILGMVAGRETWSKFVGIFQTDNGSAEMSTMEQKTFPASVSQADISVPLPKPDVTEPAPSQPVQNPALRALRLPPKRNSNPTVAPPERPVAPAPVALQPAPDSAIAPTPQGRAVIVPSNSASVHEDEIPIPPPDEAPAFQAPAFKPPEPSVRLVGSVEIVPDPYPTIRMPSGSNAPALRPGASLAFGRLISKVEPEYPTEMVQQRIAGSVKVHVLIARNGTVEKAESTEGSPLLVAAALRAVQQWRYEPTLLGGQAIEAEQNITMTFRITTNRTAHAN